MRGDAVYLSVNLPLILVWLCAFPQNGGKASEELDKSYLNVTYEIAGNGTDLKRLEYNVTGLNGTGSSRMEMLRGDNTAVIPIVGKIYPRGQVSPPVGVEPRKGGTPVGRPTTPKPSIVVTEEDKKVRREWGGNCTTYHWEICSNQTNFGHDVYDEKTKEKVASQMNCHDVTLFPPVCLFNGWTITRCHLLCMSKMCNRDLKINYDKYVSHDGFC